MVFGKFEFKGKGLNYLWLSIWTGLLIAISLGILFPWAYVAQQKWIAYNTSIDGKQLVFKGTGMGIFGTWLLIFILSIITLGLYSPWAYCRVKRWQTDNLYFAEEGDIEST
ncbi:MAG TPA: DUF898 family protein [Methanosarcinaceae archaeon]|nr:DUF898 family protein [Methanosarcinaceae archaeon]